MSRWECVPLGTLATFRNGLNYTQDARSSGGLPIVGVKDFKDRVVLDVAELEQLDAASVDPGDTVVQQGDILFVRSNGNRDLIGRSMFVSYTPDRLTTYSGFSIRTRFRDARAEPRFFAYLFRGPGIRQLLSRHGGGTNISNLNQGILARLEVPLPPLSVQHRIASILGAYDDLIEVNRRRIAVLEGMARQLFDEWFVRFRFPGGGSTELRQTSVGVIPGSWPVIRLGNACNLMQAGATPPRSESEFWDEATIDWYTTTELQDCFLFGSMERITAIAVSRGRGRIFPAGTVFLALYGASIGRIGIAVSECSSNQAALAMRPDERVIGTWFLVHTLLGLRSHFKSIAQGAAQQNISKEKVRDTEIAAPPPSLVRAFEQHASGFWEMRRNLEGQNRRLAASRDLLLPRLVSGDLSVITAERELEEAA